MKKIKALSLAGIIATSCFAGTISTSAATKADDTAYIYVTDVESEHSTDYPTPETPSAPALTAKVGDIIEVTVTATPTTDIVKFAGFWMETHFGQSAPEMHEDTIDDKTLAFTGAYYDGGLLAIPAMQDGISVITNPEPFETSSDNSFYVYTASSAYNNFDYSKAKTMYKFTLEVKKPGKTFINTTKHEVILFNKNGRAVLRPELLDIRTSVAVVSHIDKPELTGDVDGNGVLTVSDATLIQKYSASITEFTSEQKKLADVNGDGAVNILDSTALQKLILKT